MEEFRQQELLCDLVLHVTYKDKTVDFKVRGSVSGPWGVELLLLLWWHLSVSFQGAQGGPGLLQPVLQSHVHQQLPGMLRPGGDAARRLPPGAGEAHRLRLHLAHHGGREVRAAPAPGGDEVMTEGGGPGGGGRVGVLLTALRFSSKIPGGGRGQGVLRLPHQARGAR